MEYRFATVAHSNQDWRVHDATGQELATKLLDALEAHQMAELLNSDINTPLDDCCHWAGHI